MTEESTMASCESLRIREIDSADEDVVRLIVSSLNSSSELSRLMALMLIVGGGPGEAGGPRRSPPPREARSARKSSGSRMQLTPPRDVVSWSAAVDVSCLSIFLSASLSRCVVLATARAGVICEMHNSL